MPDQRVLELEAKCLLLEQQVFEMEVYDQYIVVTIFQLFFIFERFLSDYGLRWVGDGEDDDKEKKKEDRVLKEAKNLINLVDGKFALKY